jgi:hypothetical protein
MKPDRKIIHSHLKSYVKKHYWPIFTTLVLMIVFLSLFQIGFDFLINSLNHSNLNILSLIMTQWLGIIGLGCFTFALVEVIRNHEIMSPHKVFEVLKSHTLAIILLSLEMTFIMALFSSFGLLFHPLFYTVLVIFLFLAMAFAFPLMIDSPDLKPHELIEASFKLTRGHRIDMMLLQLKPLLLAMSPLLLTVFLSPNLGVSNSLREVVNQVIFAIAYGLSATLLLVLLGQIFTVFGFVYAYITSDAQHPLD